MNNKIRHTLCPILAALIWGTAFVAQSVVADDISPFTFNTMRAVIAVAVLIPVYIISRRMNEKRTGEKTVINKKALIIGGISCGTALTVASNLQQMGLSYTLPGKAGFITAMYIVLVPILGIFVGRKAPLRVWISVLIACVGLWLLCVGEGFDIALGDIYVILCAFVFAAHILIIDKFTSTVDGIALSCAQFAVTAVLSGICAAIFEEMPSAAAVMDCLIPTLYVGIFSSGVAYTLQIVSQKGGNPTVVSLLLSLESVFSVIAGAVILKNQLLPREYIGCAVVLAAVILTQLPYKSSQSNE